MTTAIIGVGNIGKSVARHLVDGGERVVHQMPRDRLADVANTDDCGGHVLAP